MANRKKKKVSAISVILSWIVIIFVIICLITGKHSSKQERSGGFFSYDEANIFFDKLSAEYSGKFIPSSITENHSLSAGFKLNGFISYHIGELDGSPYYECTSNSEYSDQNRTKFINYANKMLHALGFERQIDESNLDAYPVKKNYSDNKAFAYYVESEKEGDPTFTCKLRSRFSWD